MIYVKGLVTHLQASGLFERVFYKPVDDETTGIDDLGNSMAYFTFNGETSIDLTPTDTGIKCNSYIAELPLKLICVFRTCIAEDAAANLVKLFASQRVVLDGIRMDSHKIYFDETGQELKTDLTIIQLTMTYTTMMSAANCSDLALCPEVCC